MTTRRDQPDAVRGVLAGALGAMVGDSTLFLIARRSSSFVEPQLARARANPKVQGALDFLDRGAPMLLTDGPVCPGATWTTFPLASVVISGLITTAIIVVFFLYQRRRARTG